MGAAITKNDDNICNCDNDLDDNDGDDVYKLLRIIQISSYNRFCQQKFEIPTCSCHYIKSALSLWKDYISHGKLTKANFHFSMLL